MASNFTQKTSKDKESLIQENYQYYFKTLNKDTSKHYVCAQLNLLVVISIKLGFYINNTALFFIIKIGL